jgi:hypothetical protein
VGSSGFAAGFAAGIAAGFAAGRAAGFAASLRGLRARRAGRFPTGIGQRKKFWTASRACAPETPASPRRQARIESAPSAVAHAVQ